jgi:ribosome biogenesis GTPase / thiamine phosphate phosphatase
MSLESLGATPELRAAVPSQLSLARVALSHRDQYQLITDTATVAAEPSGALWFHAATAADMPVAGDWVAARIVNATQAIVEAVLPRRTLFARRAPGAREAMQPIAANIDFVFLVSALDHDFNLRRIERYLALAVESGAAPVIVLNKLDLCPDLPAYLAATAAIAGGTPILAIHTLDAAGLDPLRAYLADGRTVALLGSSGVGKSSIVNALTAADLRTAPVRPSDSKGRHTTSHRELVPLTDGGALIDTPGMRELQLWATEDAIDAAFEDISSLATGCRFQDCTHSSEPACAVMAALEARDLSPARWNSYKKLLAEARHHEIMADPQLARERKSKWKSIHKAQREIYKRPKHS